MQFSTILFFLKWMKPIQLSQNICYLHVSVPLLWHSPLFQSGLEPFLQQKKESS